MLRTILIVGTGGFIGSVMRYLVQYFVEKGIIIFTGLDENKLQGFEFLACPQYADIYYWEILNPHTVTLEDMIGFISGEGSADYVLSLEEVTDLTIHEFYEIYLDPDTDYCVDGKVDIKP